MVSVVTTTVTRAATAISSTVSATATSQRAPVQAGVLEGVSPTVYNPSNPIILFIIQVRLAMRYTSACREITWHVLCDFP